MSWIAKFAGKGSPKSPTFPKPRITKRHVSFGCELEFVVPFLKEGDPDPDEGLGLAPVFRIQRGADHWDGCDAVYRALLIALTDTGLPVKPPSPWLKPDNSARGIQSDIEAHYATAFQIVPDGSVREVGMFGGYSWVGVELVSPAFWNKEDNFDMVRLAVNALTTKYRLRVNPACGFHVHLGVGMGKHIDARTLRRLGAFLWAASPLLYTLHSPERTSAQYGMSCRDWATCGVSQNDGPGEALMQWNQVPGIARHYARRLGRDRYMGEAYDIVDDPFGQKVLSSLMSTVENEVVENPDRNLDHFGLPGRIQQDRQFMSIDAPADGRVVPAKRSKFGAPSLSYIPEASSVPARVVSKVQDGESSRANATSPPRPRAAPFERKIKRVQVLGRAEHDALAEHICRGGFDYVRMSEREVDRATRMDVMSGVREILSGCFSSTQTAEMLTNKRNCKHSGVNWAFYSADRFHYEPFKGKTTVEIRMASASMDADWVVAWAGICARMLEFSRDADEAEWMRIIRLLAWAQEEGGRYDVVDLLVDIGAFTQARAAEQRLAVREGGLRGWAECPTAHGDVKESEGTAQDQRALIEQAGIPLSVIAESSDEEGEVYDEPAEEVTGDTTAENAHSDSGW